MNDEQNSTILRIKRSSRNDPLKTLFVKTINSRTSNMSTLLNHLKNISVKKSTEKTLQTPLSIFTLIGSHPKNINKQFAGSLSKQLNESKTKKNLQSRINIQQTTNQKLHFTRRQSQDVRMKNLEKTLIKQLLEQKMKNKFELKRLDKFKLIDLETTNHQQDKNTQTYQENEKEIQKKKEEEEEEEEEEIEEIDEEEKKKLKELFLTQETDINFSKPTPVKRKTTKKNENQIKKIDQYESNKTQINIEKEKEKEIEMETETEIYDYYYFSGLKDNLVEEEEESLINVTLIDTDFDYDFGIEDEENLGQLIDRGSLQDYSDLNKGSYQQAYFDQTRKESDSDEIPSIDEDSNEENYFANNYPSDDDLINYGRSNYNNSENDYDEQKNNSSDFWDSDEGNNSNKNSQDDDELLRKSLIKEKLLYQKFNKNSLSNMNDKY
ncbi:RNA polymerase ii nuclear localization protein iwr1 [Anaeramoeba flamelloides]|uniref:RNA polymerase ii nuclear localization protein iwr1 n=1 Tax=Anaeramoeba flamelloides TaxID=1746091 RepID=A0ABQ8YMR9_9EUKA|nr:RNA polymerase ii nuclear localization protein iwr1 [Anaeramoeba flamelloides]